MRNRLAHAKAGWHHRYDGGAADHWHAYQNHTLYRRNQAQCGPVEKNSRSERHVGALADQGASTGASTAHN